MKLKSKSKNIIFLESQGFKGSIDPKAEFARDVKNGLSKSSKELSSKYFYDEDGSKIFSKITELPEYYLTRAGYEILDKNKDKIAQLVKDTSFSLIELGSGDGRKTKVLLSHFLNTGVDFQYIPIDISESAVDDLVKSVKNEFPSLQTTGIVTEYFKGIQWLEEKEKKKNFVLFLGSNIGNFDKEQQIVFLQSLWNSLNHDDLVLIGFDLKKDINLITKAYNDSQGVTEEFNLNLLRRINRELGANFDLSKFSFFANYNPIIGAVESFLISMEEQSVFISELGKTFNFNAWEPIHTEYSFKYSDSDIAILAHEAGYKIKTQFYDSERYFVQSIWSVCKS